MHFIILCFLFVSCSHLFYQPDRVIYSKASDAGLESVDHYKVIDLQTKIHIREFLPKGKEIGVVLFLHGNAENLTSHFIQVFWLAQNGYRLIMPDYREYGESTGKATQRGVIEDSKLALDIARTYKDKNKKLKLIVWGQSLGGAIAVPLLADTNNKRDVDLVVLDSTFDDYYEIAFDRLSTHWVTTIFAPLSYVLIDNSYSPKKFLSKLEPLKLLVVHSRDDQVIPFKFGEGIFNSYNGPKEFWRFEGFPHIGANFSEENRAKFLDYFSKI